MTEPKETHRQFEMQIDIAAPRDAVFAALTSGTELCRWFAPEASADAKVGGEIVWSWGEHHRWPQQIEILEPGRRLKTRYDSGVDDGAGGKRPLFVDFILEGQGGTTTLRLVQSGFGPEAGFQEEYDGISGGWPVELRSLRLYLEQHAGVDRRLAWSVFDPDLGAAETWKILTGDRGFACGTEVDSLTEGQAFRFETVDGDVFSGRALECHRRAFSGQASSHGDAFLRFSIEEWSGQAHIWCWLGAYDRDQSELTELQTRWDAMLERLFVAKGQSATQPGV